MFRVTNRLVKPLLNNKRYLCSFPKKFYTPEHEWINQINKNTFQMGLTKHALDQMGEIVYIEMMAQKDETINEDEPILELESVKATSGISAPVDLKLGEINHKVLDDLSQLTDEDWLFEFYTKTADFTNKYED